MSKFARIAAPYIVRAGVKIDGLRGEFDVEADELLDKATVIHCVVISNLDTDEIFEYGPRQISEALAHLARFDCLVGHNIVLYDLPLLYKLHHWTPKTGCTIIDTLVASRTILPHLDDLDDQAAAMGDPSLGKLRGRHSLEAWGVRLGMPKIGTDITDFSKWSAELQARCVGDVLICKKLQQFLRPDGYSQQAMELEHAVAVICNRITKDGIPFNLAAAERLRQQWTARRAELEAQLLQQFPSTNLNSRAQLATLLEARGWVPERRTKKTNKPQIDDEVLESLPAIYPDFTGLAEHQILGRRLGQLANGKEAWLKHVGADGRMHGAIVHIGTPHSRAAHFNPNLAQVPNPKRNKPLAAECRALFRHPGDWVLVACDQAGLQDRCFAHYLAEFDGGNYGRAFVAGVDTHWTSAIALELIAPNTERDKANKLHTALREGSKSFRYGFLFGMRGKRASEILATIIRAAQQVDPTYRVPSTNGGQALRRFEAATPGLRQLRESLEIQAAQKGWVLGLDGRRVPTGAQYKALNRIVTSAEAIICKRWLIDVYTELHARFRYGWNGDVVITAWVHDELVCCARPGLAEQVGEIMVRHAKEPGKFYDLRVPLDAEYTISRSWAGKNPNAEIPNDLSIPNFLLRCPAPPIAGATADEEVNADKPDDAVHERNGRNSDARRDLGNSRRTIDPDISDGDGPHHQMHCEDSARLAMASEVSGAPENGTDTAQENLSDAGNGKIICPFHDDHDPSLHLYADGHYHCYVCGAHGDIEELPEAPPASPPGAARSQTDTLKRGIRLWQTAVSIRGTLAERYLTEIRKLDLAILPDIDAVLRFHPRCPFDGNWHPCVIALFRDVETDAVAGIHRVALTADAEKIGRMMLGTWPRPRSIKLRSGGDQLVVGEGIETVIAGAMHLAHKSAALWAMGSAGAIRKLPLVPDFAGLTILVDRESSNTGLANACACAECWRSANRKAILAIPHQMKADFNDLIKRRMP